MNVLLITYELAELHPGEEGDPAQYQQFLDALEGFSTRAQLTNSAWLVRTPHSVADVLESLDRRLGPADRLFVAAVSGEAAWRNIDKGYDWLDEQLGRCDPNQERDAIDGI